jgi:hypothetical protein
MSIKEKIRELLNVEVFHLYSEFEGEETPRAMFVSREVAELTHEEWTGKPGEMLRATAAGVLQSFVAGDWLTIGEDPFNKDSAAIMARVDPINYEIFDFRCLAPKPGIRILGCFIDVDEFIALTWDYRDNFDDNWPEQVERCRQEWIRLFGCLPPHKGKVLNEYVSYNFKAV